MNPMTNVKNIKKLCEEELKGKNRTSWHHQYRGSAWIFVGGLPYDLTEGDIICVFSQYGEPVNINLVRDKDTGKSKGFCFICYEDQRSTDLAVDNFNGIKILGRTIRVDHVENYKPPKNSKDEQFEKNTNKLEANTRGRLVKQGDIKKEKCSPNNKSDSNESHSKTKKDAKVRRKKRKRKKIEESELESQSESESKKKRRRKSKLSDSETSLSSSSSSDELSSVSLTSSESSSSSPQDNAKNKKRKKSKNEGHKKQKTNRTIQDLKREARLIQAELKRRQQIEEQIKMGEHDATETRRDTRRYSKKAKSTSRSRSRSKSRSRGREKGKRNSKERHSKVERRRNGHGENKRKDRSSRSISRDERRCKTPEKYRENGCSYKRKV